AIAWERARTENTALVRYIEWWRTVGVRVGENRFALGYNAVHVEYRARDKLFQQVVRLLVSQLIEPRPQFIGLVNLLHADARGLGARLEQPRRGHARHEVAKIVVVEDVSKFRNEDADFLGAGTHGQLVSEVAHRRETHAGNAHVLAKSRDIFHVEFVERHNAIDGL